MNESDLFIQPDWPAPKNVKAVSTTRVGGVSEGVWNSLNLGDHVNDNPLHVAENRKRLAQALALPNEPLWLKQVHGIDVAGEDVLEQGFCADARISKIANQVCVVMTADCLPALICDRRGKQVAAVHAGWRGLVSGILEQTVSQFEAEPDELLVWLGPAIGSKAFEVGEEVRDAFVAHQEDAYQAFVSNRSGHYLANIYMLAKQRLNRAGVDAIYGGDHCTYTEEERFFSYRRDGETGRMASLIWML